MKRETIYAAFVLLALSAPVAAQGFEPGTMPPREIMRMLRATGFEPMSRPMRRGPNYVVFAVDNRDREVRIVIGARTGDIVSVAPMQTASQVPPRGGVTMGPYERMPPGYVPQSGYRSGPPMMEDEDAPPPAGYGMRPPAPIPGAPSRSSNAVPPPDRRLPARDADADNDVGPSSGPSVIPADPDRRAGLPPPPERFPQRAAPQAPAKPKPVQRAAAGPPKQTPLPKPKPEAKVETKSSEEAASPAKSAPPESWPGSKPEDAPLPN